MNLSTKIIFYFVVGLLTITGLYSGSKNANPQKSVISQHVTPYNQVLKIDNITSTTTAKDDVKIASSTEIVKKNLPVAEKKKINTDTTLKKAVIVPENVTVTVNPPVIVTIPNNTIPPKELNEKVRGAIVNIICIAEADGYLKPISGTGVIIDPKGIILTNAHIGQYFLVKDYPRKDFIRCFARNGSPAKEAYSLSLVYLPSAWVESNLSNIVSDNPLGTGENDFAILKIKGQFQTSAPLPEQYPYLNPEPNQMFIYQNEDVLIAGYPAGFLSALSISQNLYAISALTKISDFYTFYEDTIDLVSLGGTVVAEKGSSGGAVASLSGSLLGIIVTTTEGKTTGERDLRAITVNHINNKLIEVESKNLKSILSGDLDKFAEDYNKNKAPALSKLLIDQINKRTGVN